MIVDTNREYFVSGRSLPVQDDIPGVAGRQLMTTLGNLVFNQAPRLAGLDIPVIFRPLVMQENGTAPYYQPGPTQTALNDLLAQQSRANTQVLTTVKRS